MNSVTVRRQAWRSIRRYTQLIESASHGFLCHHLQQLQQWRGIRVKVLNSNLEQALALMQPKMQSSGVERLIRSEQMHHIKNCEKRILARKNLERKIQSQDLAHELKAILIKKVRGL